MIAALYVLTDGPYFGLEGVDPWDEPRDARTYRGPWPVPPAPFRDVLLSIARSAMW